MAPLAPPDSHHVSAADGWLALGDLAEAAAELDLVSSAFRHHPAVLDIRWGILAQEKKWSDALTVARQLLKLAPGHVGAWLHHAYSVRRAPDGGLQAAWDALMPALDKFPAIALIPYNLSCYACQMQQLDIARIMFHRALKIGDQRHIKDLALADPDLRALWPEIRRI